MAANAVRGLVKVIRSFILHYAYRFHRRSACQNRSVHVTVLPGEIDINCSHFQKVIGHVRMTEKQSFWCSEGQQVE